MDTGSKPGKQAKVYFYIMALFSQIMHIARSAESFIIPLPRPSSAALPHLSRQQLLPGLLPPPGPCLSGTRLFSTSDNPKEDQGPEGIAPTTKPITYAKVWAEAATPEAMEALGARLARGAGPGDAVTIRGDLGAGKTCLARGFVREVLGDPHLAVTSPSYLLDNTYYAEDRDLLVHHMDLFRLAGEGDLDVLGVPEALQNCVCLVEWPERLGALEPAARCEAWLRVAPDGSELRRVELIGYGESWSSRLMEMRQELKKPEKSSLGFRGGDPSSIEDDDNNKN